MPVMSEVTPVTSIYANFIPTDIRLITKGPSFIKRALPSFFTDQIKFIPQILYLVE